MADNPSTAATIETDWRGVADELATALRQALLRNPSLPVWAWDQGQAALARYDDASSTALNPPAKAVDRAAS